MFDEAALLLGALHVAFVLAVVLWSRKRKFSLRFSHVVWMLLLPFFGPATFILLIASHGNTAPDGEWFKRNKEKYQRIVNVHPAATQTVPLEEALLINDPQKRRALMMNMLRSDPRKYLDVLLIARFNEDPETAHYATATLLELQHQMQLEMQRYQASLKSHPEDYETRTAYIKLMNEYCQSGLLEGQLLRRQRFTLKSALEECIQKAKTPELFSMAVQNELALLQGGEAQAYAEKMLALWPDDERSWLEMMRVCAQTRDRDRMRAILKQMEEQPIDWSLACREKLQYWTGGTA